MFISRDHILAAIHEIDREQPVLPRSLGYDLVYKGRSYPPIQVMRIAHRLATGIDDWPLPGGAQTNRLLEAAGFTVVSKKKLALLRNQPLDAAQTPPGQEEADATQRITPKRGFSVPVSAPSLAAEPAPPVGATGDGFAADPKAGDYRPTLEEASADLFLDATRLADILGLLRTRKTLVLQGPPGTGKSLVARRLAALLTDPNRTERLQLHPGYAYEEFMLGFRPGVGGGFVLQEGLLLRFSRRAQADAGHAYVLILDEFNRANVGSVLGEALTLLPAELRGPQHALRLPAAPQDARPFWLPPNLYVLATMNTADRVLTALDYALRRRFPFVTLNPEFGERFSAWLTGRGVPGELVQRLVMAMSDLNNVLTADPALGGAFQIGHSYFTNPPATDYGNWLCTIIEHDLAPLLSEYYLDEPNTALRLTKELTRALEL